MKNILAVIAITLTPSFVYAADTASDTTWVPVAAGATSDIKWGGFYLGADLGYGWLDADLSIIGLPNSLNREYKGGAIGAFAGYNWDLTDSIIVGIDGDVSYNWNDDDLIPGYELGTDWTSSIRGKIGYTFDRTLIYAAGGWTATRASFKDTVLIIA